MSKGFHVLFEAKVKKLNQRVEEMVVELIADGQGFIRDGIETRETGNEWARTYYKRGIARSASKNGRVWTGDMLEDVSTDFDFSNQDVIYGEFGWVDRYQDYYGYQDIGFDHVATGQRIEGMMIMADAKEWLAQEAPKRLKRVVREL